MVKAMIVLAVCGAAVYGAAYGYGVLRVGQIETLLSQRLADAARPTPSEPVIDEAVVRKRLVDMAAAEGAQVAPEDVEVRIEPLTPTNFEKLPAQARIAIGAVQGMKNWEADAAFIAIRLTARASWGPVRREFVLERNGWVPKSALR